MNHLRSGALLSAVAVTALLSGCVVAPVGRPIAYYPAQPVYVEPAPVVVVPAPYYGYGYRGYGYGYGYRSYGYRGYRHWR